MHSVHGLEGPCHSKRQFLWNGSIKLPEESLKILRNVEKDDSDSASSSGRINHSLFCPEKQMLGPISASS
jgi:hypothetical protein